MITQQSQRVRPFWCVRNFYFVDRCNKTQLPPAAAFLPTYYQSDKETETQTQTQTDTDSQQTETVTQPQSNSFSIT